MKNKLNFAYSLLIIFSLVTCILLCILISFNHEKNAVTSELKKDLNYAANLSLDELKNYEKYKTDFRFTIIDKSGTVIYDNKADAAKMENHKNRIEFKEALEGKMGSNTRNSNTLNKDTVYYAIMNKDGNVIRISEDIQNINGAFKNIIPPILLILILSILGALYINRNIVKNIMKPIEYAADHLHADDWSVDNLDIYDELSPFMNTIKNKNVALKKNMEEVEYKTATMLEIIKNMEEGLVLVDKKKRIIAVNNSAITIFKASHNYDYTNQDIIRLSRDMSLNDALTRTINNAENQIVDIDRENDSIRLYINKVEKDGVIDGAVIFIIDRSEEKKAETLRREFSANVSHELKSPLTSINGYAELIKNGMAKDEDIKKFAQIIYDEGNSMLTLIDNILKISKLDENTEINNIEDVNIKELIEEILTVYKNDIKNKNLTVNEDIEADISYKANRALIKDMYANIISNAIKYNKDNGTININIKNNNGKFVSVIEDSGIGIAAKDLSRIFERFYTADKSRCRTNKSSGLGLSIVKHIVHYMGGFINVESTVDKGTTVKIVL